MMRVHKLGAFLLVGTLTIAGKATMAQAAEAPLPEQPVAGINLSLDVLFENSNQADKAISNYFENNIPDEYENLAFAKVTSYVNIRSEASEDSEILGKLYNNCAAKIIDKKGDWYKIQSGSVKGYIKADYLVTGQDAIKVANTVGKRIITVNTTTLKVRESSSQDSQVLDLVAEGDNFNVIKEMDGWIKISLGGNKVGYVAADFVKVDTDYETAVSIEEEQESIAEEQAANEQPANNQSSNNHSSKPVKKPTKTTVVKKPIKKPTKPATTVTDNTPSDNAGSTQGSNIASYALRFVGNPYVWGGTSLTNGADCSGFTQSVFAHFGISIPRTSRSQAASGRSVSISNIQVGDLIFYAKNGRINHVAIYIGNGRVVSASSPSTGIKTAKYNYRTPVKAVRYIN